MERNMSWRKPVPVYVPSPPLSPAPLIECEEPSIDQKEEQTPPLPDNWREVVALAKANEINLPPAVNRVHQNSAKFILGDWEDPVNMEESKLSSKKLPDLPTEPPLTMEEDYESFQSFPTDPTPPTHLPTQRGPGRGLPTDYRPPTPPLPNPTKKRTLLSDITSDNHTLGSSDAHLPSIQGNHVPPHKSTYNRYINHSRTGAGAASLKTTPSFLTENTLVSMNTSYSMGWPTSVGGGPPPMRQGRIQSSPTTIMAKELPRTNQIKKGMQNDMDYPANISSCGCLPDWVKKIKNLFIFRK